MVLSAAGTPSDTIDIVRDAVAPGEYKAEEDPRLYRSVKTGRGPLADDWAHKAAQTGPLMCAYKLCKVEFRYWGMQAKIEQFIHDVGEHHAAGGAIYPTGTSPVLEPGLLMGHSVKPSFPLDVGSAEAEGSSTAWPGSGQTSLKVQ